MRALESGVIVSGDDRYRGLRFLAILGLAWIALAGSAAAGESTEAESGYQAPVPAALALAQAPAAPQPAFGSGGAAPLRAATTGAIPGSANAIPARLDPTGERSDPSPPLFERVSYRTTAPPRNG
jgi:hypothetical protein